MVNYLARLGWSHGDDEIFSREQFLQWFDLDHLGAAPRSSTRQAALGQRPAHEDHARRCRLAELVAAQLQTPGAASGRRAPAEGICALFRTAATTTVALADWAARVHAEVAPQQADRAST